MKSTRIDQVEFALARLVLDAVDLVVEAVDEDDPLSSPLGVAPLGLVEDLGHHLAGVLDDAGGQPLGAGLRPLDVPLLVVLASAQDVRRGADHRRAVVDRADLRHPLAVALLALRQARLELVRGLPSRSPRRLS